MLYEVPMPKIIENVRESLIAEAKKQVLENGFTSLSIRSVAKACDIASGTVYNYFDSKETLVASFMAEDWQNAVNAMKNRCQHETDAISVLRIIHEELESFISDRQSLFNDPQAGAIFNVSGKKYHNMLISQLLEIAGTVCTSAAKTKDAPVAEFAVETLLLWTIQGRSFSDYILIISSLFQ